MGIPDICTVLQRNHYASVPNSVLLRYVQSVNHKVPAFLIFPAFRPVDARTGQVYSEARFANGRKVRFPAQALMNLPNTLTLLRIFFVPVLIVVLLTRSPNVELFGVPMHFEVFGVAILLLAAATDWADGYFARRRLQVTTLGILLDPIADKLLISAAFVSLVDMHLVPAWMVVIIIGREFTVLGLRNIASAEGFTIEASVLGKTKMVLQVCAVAVLIVGNRYPSLKPAALFLLWLVVISALVSAAQYFQRFWGHVDDRIKQRRKLRMLESRKKTGDAVSL
jgi:CDP-diacylglycerol--glycerol-3-phosphate 3-phosphatidyltransferase